MELAEVGGSTPSRSIYGFTQEIKIDIKNKKAEDVAIHVNYKNWRGEISIRKIIPLEVYFGSTEYHKEEQWLLRAWDVGKEDYRTYALKDVLEWIKFP